MLMKVRFLSPLSVCFAMAIFCAGCESPDVAVKEKDTAKVEPAASSSKAEIERASREMKKSEAGSESASKPADGSASKPVDGSDSKPVDGSDSKPVEGAGTMPPSPDVLAVSPGKGSGTTNSGDAGFEVVVAEGAMTLDAPASWEKAEPRSRIVEYEIKIPKSAGEADDAADGQLTSMGARGSVEANLERWYGQYTQPDGGSSKDATKLDESKVADCEVTWFDLSGTLMDRPGGPFAGGKMIERENYRTLAVIIQAGGDVGQYFVKLYGPAKTIGENEAAFKAFVESMKVAK